MKILLSSTNPSKRASLEKALKKMEIENFELLSYKVESGVSSKPIGFEINRGADNRNQALKMIANTLGIDYDYLCSIEGGVSLEEDGHPYLITYVIIEDKWGRKSSGHSVGIRLTREMFRYYREGNSLNQLIESISSLEKNKEKGGIGGYLTKMKFLRSEIDAQAIFSAFTCLEYQEERDALDEEIKKRV